MTIPEPQFKTWSHQGETTTSKATHESIRTALDSRDSIIKTIKRFPCKVCRKKEKRVNKV